MYNKVHSFGGEGVVDNLNLTFGLFFDNFIDNFVNNFVDNWVVAFGRNYQDNFVHS
jgi:hypothetical protein